MRMRADIGVHRVAPKQCPRARGRGQCEWNAARIDAAGEFEIGGGKRGVRRRACADQVRAADAQRVGADVRDPQFGIDAHRVAGHASRVDLRRTEIDRRRQNRRVPRGCNERSDGEFATVGDEERVVKNLE
jgi:hypothetical protein